MTCAGVIDYSHGEPEDLQGIVSSLCTVDMNARCGGKNGVDDLKAHPYFAGFNWDQLAAGDMEAPIKPNVNDINAPSAKEIEAFKPPKGETPRTLALGWPSLSRDSLPLPSPSPSLRFASLVNLDLPPPLPPLVDLSSPSLPCLTLAFPSLSDVPWTDEDQAKFAKWDFMDADLWQDEACFRMRKKGEVGGKPGGGGGCCVIA